MGWAMPAVASRAIASPAACAAVFASRLFNAKAKRASKARLKTSPYQARFNDAAHTVTFPREAWGLRIRHLARWGSMVSASGLPPPQLRRLASFGASERVRGRPIQRKSAGRRGLLSSRERCKSVIYRHNLRRRPQGDRQSERGGQMEWMSFDQARQQFSHANPKIWATLTEVYEGAAPADQTQLKFVRAQYRFGTYVLRGGRAFATTGDDLENALKHSQVRCPLAMVLKNKFEVIDKEPVVTHAPKEDARIFHGLTEAIIPEGGFIGLFETLDYALNANGPAAQHWTISAGARNYYPMFLPLPLGTDDKNAVRKRFKEHSNEYDSALQLHELVQSLAEMKGVADKWSADLLFFSPSWADRIKNIAQNATKNPAITALLSLLAKGWGAEAKVRTAGPTFMDALYELGGTDDAKVLYASAWLLQIADEITSARRPCYAYIANDDTMGPFPTIEAELLAPLKRPARILRPTYLDAVNVGYLPLTSVSGAYFISDPGNRLRSVTDCIGRAMLSAPKGNAQGGRIGLGAHCRRLPVLEDDSLFANLTFRVPSFDADSRPITKQSAMRTVRIDPRNKRVVDALSEEQFFAPAFVQGDTTPTRGFFKACMRLQVTQTSAVIASAATQGLAS